MTAENCLKTGVVMRRRQILGEHLQPIRHQRYGNRRAAQKQHGHVEKLPDDLSLLHGINDRSNNVADGAERQQPERNEQEQRSEPIRHGHSIHTIGKNDQKSRQRQVIQQRNDERGNQYRSRPQRRDLETAQDVLLSIHDGNHRRAEKTGAEDAKRQNHAHNLTRATLIGTEQLTEHEKEYERQQVPEEDYSAGARH